MPPRLAPTLAAVAMTLMPALAPASTFKVAPVTITLDEKGAIQVLKIENGTDDQARMQLRLFEWKQSNGQDILTPTRDIVANPSIFPLSARAAQIVRIGRLTSPTVGEKSYRLLIEEVPDDAAANDQGVTVLLRISIPVFSAAPVASVQKIDWRARFVESDKVELQLENAGNAHVKFHKIALSSIAGNQVNGQFTGLLYLLPGTTRSVTIALSTPVRAGDSLRLVASEDGNELRTNVVVGPRSDVPISH